MLTSVVEWVQSFIMPQKRVNDADSFCFVCGDGTVKLNWKTITPLTKKSHELYFGWKIGEQDKPWALHIVYAMCVMCLRGWLRGNQRSKPFAVLTVWEEQDHLTDCYFCLTKRPGTSSKSKHRIQHPSLPSAVWWVPQSQDLLVSKPPEKWITDDNNDDKPVPME